MVNEAQRPGPDARPAPVPEEEAGAARARRHEGTSVAGAPCDPEAVARSSTPSAGRLAPTPLYRYVASPAAVALCTLLCLPFEGRVEPANLVMVYLAGVVLVATRLGRGPAVLASFLSVLAFDFFLVPPRFSFAVADTQYVFTFLVMLLVALVVGNLTVQLRDAAERSRLREERTAQLSALSRKLATLRGQGAILRATAQHLAEVFDSDVVALLPDAAGRLEVRDTHPPGQALVARELGVAQRVHDLGHLAGRGTGTLPDAERLYVPLVASRGSFGVLGLKAAPAVDLLLPEQLQLLEAMARQAALVLEVDRLTEAARDQQVQIETERLRNALLSSVSHDLRTPLAAITGAASSLLAAENPLPEPGRREMVETIYEEAERLGQQVSNLLEMSRLEAGTMSVRKELQPLEETIGSACQLLDRPLAGRPLRITLAPDLPLVPADGVLLERVFFNLLENAVKYTPPGSELEIAAERRGEDVVVEVRDRGPGLGAGEEDRIFEKFYRGATHGQAGGVGLGLTICRGIIRGHGGRIAAENRPGGGATFRFTLPLGGAEAARPAPAPGPRELPERT